MEKILESERQAHKDTQEELAKALLAANINEPESPHVKKVKEGPEDDEQKMWELLERLEKKLSATEEAEKRLLKMEEELSKKQDALEKKGLAQSLANPGNFPVDSRLAANLQKLEQLMSRVNLDELDQKLSKLDQLSRTKTIRNLGGKTYAEIKQELETLQKIIFDPTSAEKDKEKANIMLEKTMQDLEKTSEFQQEIRRVQIEERKKNEPLNKEAYDAVLAKLSAEKDQNPAALRKRLTKHPELTLIFLSKEQILKKHESDFKNYVLNITEQELRALRHVSPNFRPDQETQQRFLQTLDNKIKEAATKPAPKPQLAKHPKKVWKPKPAGGAAGDFLSEIKKRGGK